MTLSEIRTEVMSRAGDNSLTSTQIDRWVNLAINQAASRGSFAWNIATKSTDTTTNGTREYALPSDFKRMISVKIGTASGTTEPNATELGFVRYEDKDTGETGFYLNPSNDYYGILPTPSTTGLPIYLKYYQIPTALSATTDEPPFPTNYHELVIYFALKKYWEVSDDFGKAVYYDREFENMIDQMKTDLMNRAVGSRPRMMDIREF